LIDAECNCIDILDFKTTQGLIYRDAPQILAEMEDAYKKSH